MTDYHFRSKPGEAGEYIELQMTSGSGIAGVSPRGEKLMIFGRTDTDEMYQKDGAGYYKRMAGLPPRYIKGGVPEYVSGTVYVASGGGFDSFMRDEDNTFDITWSGAIYFLASATGASGVASGVTLTSGTVYHFHAIADSTNTNPVAGLIDDSFTNPNIPPGYDKNRYLFSVPTVSSSDAFLHMHAIGDGDSLECHYDASSTVLVGLWQGAAVAFTDIDLTHLVPSEDHTVVFLHCDFDPGAVNREFALRPDNSAIPWNSNVLHYEAFTANIISHDIEMEAHSGLIEYRVENGTDKLTVYVKGFRLWR